MVKQLLEVIKEYDPKRDYGIYIRPQYARVLSILKKGEKINPDEFIKQNQNKFTRKNSFNTARGAIYHAITKGKKIGVLKKLPQEKSGVPISFDNFCKLQTISYWMKQLRTTRYKNIKPPKNAGTGPTYAYRVWNFNTWLHGRNFQYTSEIHTGGDLYKKEKVNVILKGVEHLLEIYKDSYKSDTDFIHIIKEFLMDPIHEGSRASTVKGIYNAIKSYFEKNESALNFKFDYKANHISIYEQDDLPSLSLDQVMELLTVGKPTQVQKAVFLVKFHRGLDISTLIDRFNFEAWDQLVKAFGTEDYKKWDLSKCPVEVKLTRIKTACSHIGYLDRDAVEAIQKYLDLRFKQTYKPMRSEQPLFINAKGGAINDNWVKDSFRKLRKNAGLDILLEGYKQNRYKVSGHEFRDLLKSTLIDCGVRADLADHFIGHKPKDSYEKQALLYTKSLRTEYMKASKRLNIFSNFSSMVKGSEDIDELSDKMIKMETELAMIKKRQQRSDKLRRK